MGGDADKAVARLGAVRLVDRVIARLKPQADRILISGPADYGAGLEIVPDAPDAPLGPAAGIFSVSRYLRREGAAERFVTAPVDGPFLPEDLIERLASDAPSVAADEEGVHPTFACWTLAALDRANAALAGAPSVSLKGLATMTGARVVRWPGAGAFANINTPEDLARWARILESRANQPS